MIVLNFSHPLTDAQKQTIELMTGSAIDHVKEIPVMFEHDRPFAEQARQLVDQCGLTPAQWQTEPIIVVPPALNFITAVVLAELHGRMGFFPPIVRLRPVEGSTPPRFEVAEIIKLQDIRDQARKRRGK